MDRYVFHGPRTLRCGLLQVLAAFSFFIFVALFPVIADQPVLEDGAFVSAMTPASEAADSLDASLTPDAGLEWIAGPLNDTVSAGFSLPGVVWYPAMSAQTWYGTARDPSTFTMASAMGLNPVRDTDVIAELVSPHPAWAASTMGISSALPKLPGEKSVTPVKNPAKPAEKTAEKASTSGPAAATKPVAAVKKDAPVSATKEKSAQAAKDPVPSPATVHNKEITAKSRENPRLAASKILTTTSDAVLESAPVPVTPPSPALNVPVTSRTVTGEQGSIVEIAMDGHGWLFTGAPGTSVSATFIDKKTQKNNEIFRFRLTREGLSSLGFKRQDLSSGFADEVNVSLIAMPRGGVKNQDPGQPVQTAYAPRTQAAGNQAQVQPTAVPVYQAPAAVLAPAPLDLSGIPETGRLGYARELARSGHAADALRLLEPLAKAAGDDLDETLFLMAGIYQDDAGQRDLKKAFTILVRLQKEFPRSQFATRAREQALYLKRTFQID